MAPRAAASRAQGGHASVNSPYLARDPPRLVAEEEQRRRGDVVGLPDLAERVTVPTCRLLSEIPGSSTGLWRLH